MVGEEILLFFFFWVFVFLMWGLIGEMGLHRNCEWRWEIVAAFTCVSKNRRMHLQNNKR